jgi:hypothetical protein
MVFLAVGCTVAVAATNWNRILLQAGVAGRPSRIPSPTLPLAESRFLHSCCGPAPWGPQIRSQPAHQITTGRQLAMAESLASSQGTPNPREHTYLSAEALIVIEKGCFWGITVATNTEICFRGEVLLILPLSC